MRILVTGADGFIGKNLISNLETHADFEITPFTRFHSNEELRAYVAQADFIFHLAGVNRPLDPHEFQTGNVKLTELLCQAIAELGKKVPIVFSSSIQAERYNAYGKSKIDAENALLELNKTSGSPIYICRLPNVFGKWAKPNYNSAVATFCHNISSGLPIDIHDPDALISLVYIDDLVEQFISLLNEGSSQPTFVDVTPVYEISVGDLADQLYQFRQSRETLVVEPVGEGLTRALYSTYLSYLTKDNFTYEVPVHGDSRGVFVEMVKTHDSGQVSYFTAEPGITRGGHYHHSKNEKFLVISGEAKFRFRHIISGECHELVTSGDEPVVVETVPGWSHDITNIGDSELIVMLWANEVFDQGKPDTYAFTLNESN
jgi:UDP-2-acetamido-2,6-beta-L-arabino-hexul-4-ose reductase